MKLPRRLDKRLVAWARAWVRQSGFTLERLPEHVPAGLEACLRELLAAVPSGAAVLYTGASRLVLERLRAAAVA